MIYAVRDYAHARKLAKELGCLKPGGEHGLCHYVSEPHELLGFNFDTLAYPLFVHYDLVEDVRRRAIVTGSKQEVQFI